MPPASTSAISDYLLVCVHKLRAAEAITLRFHYVPLTHANANSSAERASPLHTCSHALLPPTKEEVNAFVCLSVSKITKKNAWMDWDEMLRVDRCRDMDELINF